MMSPAERKVFLNDWATAIDRLAFSRDPVVREIFKWVIDGALMELPQVEKMEKEQLIEMLRDSAKVLKSQSQRREAREYARALVGLAEEVAAASRGRFGFGPKVGPEEEQMLVRIRSTLRLRAR